MANRKAVNRKDVSKPPGKAVTTRGDGEPLEPLLRSSFSLGSSIFSSYAKPQLY